MAKNKYPRQAFKMKVQDYSGLKGIIEKPQNVNYAPSPRRLAFEAARITKDNENRYKFKYSTIISEE